MNSRRRSSSISEAPSLTTTLPKTAAAATVPSWDMLHATQDLWELVCDYALNDPTTQQNLLHSTRHVCLSKALLDRAHQLDHYSRIMSSKSQQQSSKNKHDHHHHSLQNSQWLVRMLQQGDGENGYTPLHWAVLHAKLPVLLLLLRYTVATSSSHDHDTTALAKLSTSHKSNSTSTSQEAYYYTPVMSHQTRLLHRPLALLQGNVPNLSEEARAVFATVDKEGLTALQLLERLQVTELQRCRQSLVFSPLQGIITRMAAPRARAGRPRQNAVPGILQEAQEQNELAGLHNYLQQEQNRPTSVFQGYTWDDNDNDNDTDGSLSSLYYACEVLAFGRPNHLALGVQGGTKHNHHHHHHHERTTPATSSAEVSSTSTSTSSSSSTTFRPHRVQTFAQDRVGRPGSAVAIAAAAHHTLVATRQGHLYAFGVGTGGRLGTGPEEQHCPAPTRVLGPLAQRKVVAIAAAENHSLCVTSEGAVYAFGSNRFGQLGYSSSGSGTGSSATDNTKAGESASRCCLPRRVDDLWKKHILCISVAAGEKHSVALSQKGEVYVWGCNASGQLGINHRRSTSNSQMAHKVQRVDTLWNDDKQRRCFQIAASSQATLVLAKPNAGGLPVNQVYAWGHGNHVPSKVHLSDPTEQDSQRHHTGDKYISAAAGRRSVNPVAIACARHHNAAITSDGRVYTWGLHADPLGGQISAAQSTSKSGTPKAAKNNCSRPQLVTGMLPEEGGGFAVAVSASENHTAVVTNEGALFTWGASYGKGVLGHEGVRWQPSPKRVCGVNRAVAVSAAKEHTILLMGATFPPMKQHCSPAPSKIPSLEQLAAQEVAKHVDLFNALPILMTAERTNCRYLVEHCQEFVRLNLDGVLNVGQKSIMDMYLNEQVASGLLLLDEDPRDRRERPLIMRIALAASGEREGLLESETILSDPVDWMKSCEKLSKKDTLKQLVNRIRREAAAARPVVYSNPKFRCRSSSSLGSYSESFGESGGRPRSSSNVSDGGRERKMSSSERCIMLTTNMDLSSRELVQAKHDCLSKEIRGLKKRLNQISKLESLQKEGEEQENPTLLSAEQQEKIGRRSQLESELCIFQPALARVEKRMGQYNLRPRRLSSEGATEVEERSNGDQKSMASPEQTEAEQKSPENKAQESARAVSLRCAMCNIACPDETSYALHMSGRKHRNRVAQEAEEERTRTAAAIMEERHRQQLQAMSNPKKSRQPPPTPLSAWSKKKENPTTSAKPKYKLPSPPNQAQEIVEKKSKSLQEIMAEEERVAGTRVKAPASSFGPLQLPPGSAPSMKSPPWASKQLVTPKKVAASPPPPWLSASPKTTPLQLPKGTPPSMSSPPWASKPIKAIVASPSTVFPVLGSPQVQRATTALGDFLRKAPTTPLNVRSPSSSAPWSAAAPSVNRPGFGKTPLVPKQKASPNAAINFTKIQKQEVDFKNVQDQTFQDNGKWFIERRERAGSLATIQQAEDKAREEQLMIEEQMRIEADIMRELALQKKKEEAKKKRQQQKAKKKQANKNSKQKPKPPQNESQQPSTTKTKGDSSEGGSKPQEKANANTGGTNPNKGKGANTRRRKNSNASKCKAAVNKSANKDNADVPQIAG